MRGHHHLFSPNYCLKWHWKSSRASKSTIQVFFTKNQLRQHHHCDWPALVEVQKGGEDTQMGYRWLGWHRGHRGYKSRIQDVCWYIAINSVQWQAGTCPLLCANLYKCNVRERMGGEHIQCNAYFLLLPFSCLCTSSLPSSTIPPSKRHLWRKAFFFLFTRMSKQDHRQ